MYIVILVTPICERHSWCPLFYHLFQLYNIIPGILDWLPGKHRDAFALLQKAQGYVKKEADARLKHLDAKSTPQDYIEAFLIKMIQVEKNALCA